MLNPTVEQVNIRTALTSTDDNLMVIARAGTGKSTTIVWLQQHIPRRANALLAPSVVFLAFSKPIAEALRPKVPSGTTVATFHSLGLRALRSSGVLEPRFEVKAKGEKVRNLVYDRMDRDDPDLQNVIRLVSLMKGQSKTLDRAELASLVAHHDLDLQEPKRAFAVAESVLEASNRDLKTIDYDDMLYLAVRHNVSFPTQDFVFVDEAQDTNDIQLEIVDRLLGRMSRLIAVGDPAQAIYGFRGANADSMRRISERYSCVELPLSVSWRCPKAVCAEANKYIS